MFRSGFLSVMSLGVVAVLLVAAAAGLTTWWVDGPEGQELTGVTVDLLELDESGHSGWAALIKEGSGGEDTEVRLDLAPDVEGSILAHIHLGTCEELGGVAYPLIRFASGSSETLLTGVSLEELLEGEFAVDTHRFQTPSVSTACGDIVAGDAGSEADGETPWVALQTFLFVPDVLQVTRGETARFKLVGKGASHTFTIPELGIDIVTDKGATYTVEFDVPEDAPDELQLVCRFHRRIGMVGSVRVVGGEDGTSQGGGY